MQNEINFIFSIGYRCYSVDFINNYNLRKFSGPFDYLFIDLESALKIINNKFSDFLNDIIIFNKNDRIIDLFYKKNTNEINYKFIELLEKNISYMADNYNNKYLLFNQNYLNNNILSGNLYDWEHICIFIHHHIIDNNIHNIIYNRCERFNNIMNKYNNTSALFYITKIVTCPNIIDYMNEITEMKKKYKNNCFLIMIICSDNLDDNHYYHQDHKCLFIIKKVENYDIQRRNYKTDNKLINNLNYDNE